jgi:hypothetical protein
MARLPRIFPGRYILAFLLVIGIGIVVFLGRALGGQGGLGGVTAGARSPVPVVGASGAEDDGVETPESPLPPSTRAGAIKPQALATAFLTEWLRHTGVTADQWYARLVPYVTNRLAGELHGADPTGVPASRITGAVTLVEHGTTLVEASVPVDSGTVTLRLLATNGEWFVDGIDWSRA